MQPHYRTTWYVNYTKLLHQCGIMVENMLHIQLDFAGVLVYSPWKIVHVLYSVYKQVRLPWCFIIISMSVYMAFIKKTWKQSFDEIQGWVPTARSWRKLCTLCENLFWPSSYSPLYWYTQIFSYSIATVECGSHNTPLAEYILQEIHCHKGVKEFQVMYSVVYFTNW